MSHPRPGVTLGLSVPDVNRIRFDQNDIDNVLAMLSDEQIDSLAFGAIRVDSTGVVLTYSRRESQITQRDPSTVIGRNFFREVAPCTRQPEFFGRFRELVRGGPAVVFDYTFDYRMNPTRVRVHMARAILSDTYWILVERY